MAHYAFLDENNMVTEVIPGVLESELIEGLDPETWYSQFRGQVCKRYSYNTFANQHLLEGTPFRYNRAEIGGAFYPNIGPDGAFAPLKPYPSWVLNEETCRWKAPVPYPDMTKVFEWNEQLVSWVEIEETPITGV
jgi:hypothetical protein